ncbi:uncharacterized protein LOC101864008 isoform X1 [Aplysia californica]|uniref:Uncharacterized protein LOC101864008 isoform X1 n=1 Tax=Aplysia californica TaxID=6500 RepID=A0ABM0K011_APLCA|nr:uncharacterized protein LOC101864008 isoform X1 [Aplysia californica]
MSQKRNQYFPKWREEDLRLAMDAVANGMKKSQAAKMYGIPWGTFSDKLSGRRKIVPSHKTVLTPEEEKEVVEWLFRMANAGFSRTKEELLLTVKGFLDVRGRETSWPDNKPSDKWFRLFRQRHPTITFRKSQKLGILRASLTAEAVEGWFARFSDTIKSIDPTILQEPGRIFNADESGFAVDATSGRVLGDMNNKYTYEVGSETQKTITALVCANAVGHYTKPMLIFPGTQFHGFRPQDVFQESFVARSSNGGINEEVFGDWLENVFIPDTAALKKPVLLLLDGHVSHQSLRASQLCQENSIVLYCLPAHISHIMQPLDVAVFKTMKAEWKTAAREQNFKGEVVTKRNFAAVFKKAYMKTTEKPLCPTAFRKSGIFPLDFNSVDLRELVVRSPPPATLASYTPSPPPLITASPAASACVSPAPSECASRASSECVSTASSECVSPASSECVSTASSECVSTASSECLSTASSECVSTAPSACVSPAASACVSPAPSACVTRAVSASSSSESPASTLGNTLQKFAMICNRVDANTLQGYFKRLENGSPGDPLFDL